MNSLEFKFEIDKQYIKHLPDVSYYNNNYYELDLIKCGDYIIPQKCNILYVETDEFFETDYYSLGYFENNKFVPCFTWLNDFQDFIGIKVKEKQEDE